MRPDLAVVFSTLFISAVVSAIDGPRPMKRIQCGPSTREHEFYKRRGGGHGGGKGSRPSSGSGTRGGSSSGSGSGGQSSDGSSSSNHGSSGGHPGTGPQPSIAGRYYPGGSSKPYRSGSRSPGGIVPLALADRDILCGCSKYEECACEYNNDTAYFDDLIGGGQYHYYDSIIDLADVNGTITILINGTLPNGTALPSYSAPENTPENRPENAAMPRFSEDWGWWLAVAAVMLMVFMA
ncbi:hypothetical protein FCOIX_11688 [Fusarium coicis]|nr:hypothetical protein FCOIX_11688 [Fusarium coicis]